MTRKAKPAGHYSNQGCGPGFWPRPAPVLQSGYPQGAGEEESEAKQVLGFPCSPFRKVSLALCRKLWPCSGACSRRKANELAVPPDQAEGSNLRKSSEKQNRLGLENIMAIQAAELGWEMSTSCVWRHVSKWMMSEIWKWKLIFINHNTPGNQGLHWEPRSHTEMILKWRSNLQSKLLSLKDVNRASLQGSKGGSFHSFPPAAPPFFFFPL